MTERYPDDATLLSLTADAATGAEYIATGTSPYVLEFRKLIQRMLVAVQRSNDLRVYQDGDLTFGVRPGRCLIGETAVDFAGQEEIAATVDTTTYVWLDGTGTIQVSTSSLPNDRTTFIPLAQVQSDAQSIQTIVDLRGEVFLQVGSLPIMGITATAQEINQVLDGIGPNVQPTTLDLLCDGPTSTADSLHRHTQFFQDVAGEAELTLINDNDDPAASVGIRFSLPQLLAANTHLVVDPDNGFLVQRFDSDMYHLVGAVHAQFTHTDELTGTLSDLVVGVVPISGIVTDVVLTVGQNIESTEGSDGVTASIQINGVAIATTDPAIQAQDGNGPRTTAQGDGDAAVIRSDGPEVVTKGDLIKLDLIRIVSGTVSTEAADIGVVVVIRATQPQ